MAGIDVPTTRFGKQPLPHAVGVVGQQESGTGELDQAAKYLVAGTDGAVDQHCICGVDRDDVRALVGATGVGGDSQDRPGAWSEHVLCPSRCLPRAT